MNFKKIILFSFGVMTLILSFVFLFGLTMVPRVFAGACGPGNFFCGCGFDSSTIVSPSPVNVGSQVQASVQFARDCATIAAHNMHYTFSGGFGSYDITQCGPDTCIVTATANTAGTYQMCFSDEISGPGGYGSSCATVVVNPAVPGRAGTISLAVPTLDASYNTLTTTGSANSGYVTTMCTQSGYTQSASDVSPISWSISPGSLSGQVNTDQLGASNSGQNNCNRILVVDFGGAILGNYAISANVSSLANGNYTLTTSMIDSQGNTQTVNKTFTISRVALPMSGTLTPASPTCTIASGASSCNVNLTWTTTNPVATSAVTAVGMTNVNGNNGGPQAFVVPYPSRTFYLYNNAVLLAQTTGTASCIAGTFWNGSSCATLVSALSALCTSNSSSSQTMTLAPGTYTINFNFLNSGASGSIVNVTLCTRLPTGNFTVDNPPNCPPITLTKP
jgi:hypothetical protein